MIFKYMVGDLGPLGKFSLVDVSQLMLSKHIKSEIAIFFLL